MKKITKRALTAGTALALLVGGAAVCLAVEDAQTGHPQEATGVEYISVGEWAERHPIQYESFEQYQVRDNVKHGHYGIGMRLLAPLQGRHTTSFPLVQIFYKIAAGNI